MKKIITITTLILLAGCANKAKEIDVRNSPCACEPYMGQPLNTTPSDAELKQLELEWFEWELLG